MAGKSNAALNQAATQHAKGFIPYIFLQIE